MGIKFSDAEWQVFGNIIKEKLIYRANKSPV